MNKKWKALVMRLLCAVMLTAAISFQSFAANAKIAFSDPSGEVGQEISVTMKFTSTSGDAMGNTDVMLAYDAAKLEYINETEMPAAATVQSVYGVLRREKQKRQRFCVLRH